MASSDRVLSEVLLPSGSFPSGIDGSPFPVINDMSKSRSEGIKELVFDKYQAVPIKFYMELLCSYVISKKVYNHIVAFVSCNKCMC